MLTLLAWLILIATIWVAAFYKLKPRFWIPAFAILLFIYTFFSILSIFSLLVCWLIWFILSALIVVAPLRCRFITLPLLHWFRRQQPPLSQAEKEVLESGGIWWEAEFFTGKPNWNKLLRLEKPTLTEQEQKFLDNQVETLCAMLDDWEIVHKEKDLPQEVWNYIKKEKFWGLVIDKKYGGYDFSALAHSTIVSKIASRSISAAFTVMVPNSLGPAEFLQRYGTESQKQNYLPRLAHGEEVPCFALTAPEAGSDATSIKDTGIICKGEHEGKEIIGIRLSWDKRYITLAPIATLLGLAFKLYDPNHLFGDKEEIGITLALVPTNQPGVEIGPRHFPLNLTFLNGPTRGRDVFIPLDWVIGGKERLGQGWQMMMECLAIGRGISLPAVATSVIKFCLRTTSAYTVIRRQFHRSIGEFDGVRSALAQIAGFAYIAEATRLFTAQAVTTGARPAVASAIAKCHLTELARKAANNAMDIHAGRAVQLGPRNYLANLYNSLPICVTVEGANILTRSLIIFGQGVVREHLYLRDELAAASEPDQQKSCRAFNRLLLAHSGFMVNQIARLFGYAVTAGKWIKAPVQNFTAKYYQQLTRMSNAFVVVTEVALIVMGGELKIKETLSARLGDVLSHLYFAAAVLKYFHDEGELEEDRIFLEWSVQYCLYQSYQAISNFLDNFPVAWLGNLMQKLIFPWGTPFRYPRDQLSMQIAKVIQTNQVLRDRLTRYCYIGKESNDPSGRVELAFKAVLAAMPLSAKMKSNNSQLTAEEEAIVAHAMELCKDAIAVDEFNIL